MWDGQVLKLLATSGPIQSYVRSELAHSTYPTNCQTVMIFTITLGSIVLAGLIRTLYGARNVPNILTELGIDFSAAALALGLIFPAERYCKAVPMFGQSNVWLAAVPVIAAFSLALTNQLRVELIGSNHATSQTLSKSILSTIPASVGALSLFLSAAFVAGRII